VDETGYIPKSLEAQERFLWWDFDQAILFLLVMGMGVVVRRHAGRHGFRALVAWQYGRLKTGKHPKFALHALYWWLPSWIVIRARATPPSHHRFFLG
jgi:conjugal transfer pilus assembly protein TraL